MNRFIQWLIELTQRVLKRKRADFAARRARLPALRYTDYARYEAEMQYLDMVEGRMRDVEEKLTTVLRAISKSEDSK